MSAPNNHEVFVGLGSNISPEEHLPQAICLLREYTTIVAWSQAWETPPYGMAGDNFLNAVVHLCTYHSANALKNLVLRRIEAMLRRVRTHEKFIPRTLDLDILVFDGNVQDDDVWTQAHWAVPLAELLPAITNAETGESLAQAAQRLKAATPNMRVLPNVFAS